jgi:unsaturated rhamnogalacturonyl hydrolase
LDLAEPNKNWAVHQSERMAKKILEKSLSWLNNIPKTKLKTKIDSCFRYFKNQYTNKTLQSWQEASLLLGLNEAYQKNENPKIKYEILKFVNSKIDKQGNWIVEPKEVDTAF